MADVRLNLNSGGTLSLDVGNSQPLVLGMNGGTAALAQVFGIGEQGLPGPGSAAWTAAQAVVVGSVRQAPDGSWIKSTAARTTRATFDSTEQGFWKPVLATAGTLEYAALYVYTSGWVTVQAAGGTAAFAGPAGTATIPKFSANWTHQDASAPVQFRIIGTVVEWRGPAGRTGSPVADEAIITGLSGLLVPSYRAYNFAGRSGFFGNTKAGFIVSDDSVRWEEGASFYFYLDGCRYDLSNT